MTIIQPCPECGNTFVFAEAQAHTTVQCPKCSLRFEVQHRFLQYLIHSPKGADASSTFYHAVDLETNTKVLLQFPPKPVVNDPDYRAWIESQAGTFSEFNHPHSTPYLGLIFSHGEGCLIWEDSEAGTLAARIKLGRRLAEAEVLNIAIKIASALKAAADLEYFHGAITPARIQFSQVGVPRLVGIGFPFPITDESVREGNIYYLAPECLNDIGDYRSDIYGLGACIFHALTGYQPLAGSSATNLDVIQRMKRTTLPIPVLNPPISEPTTALLKRMLVADPDLRLSDYGELISLLQAAHRGLAGTPRTVIARASIDGIKSPVAPAPSAGKSWKQLFQGKRSDKSSR